MGIIQESNSIAEEVEVNAAVVERGPVLAEKGGRLFCLVVLETEEAAKRREDSDISRVARWL